MALSREDVLACLKQIKAPSGVDLVEAGLVRALTVEDDKVRFVMEVDSPDPFKAAKEEAGQSARDFTGDGNRQYLTGLNLGGNRIVILDSNCY